MLRLRGVLADVGRVAPDEREFAGATGGAFWFTAGLTMTLVAVIPGLPHRDIGLLLTMSIAALVYGILCEVAIPWSHAPLWLLHSSTIIAFPLVAVAMYLTGGAYSPAIYYLIFVIVYAAYFYAPRAALLYVFACILTALVPALYTQGHFEALSISRIIVFAPGAFMLAGVILVGKATLRRMRERAESLAAEQGALRRVATAVVDGETPDRFYERVSREAAQLLGAGAAGILRLKNAEEAIVMGSWTRKAGGRMDAGTVIPVRPGGDVKEAILTARPVRVEDHPPESPVGQLGWCCSIVAPVRVRGGVWGVIAIAVESAKILPRDADQRLTTFGTLLATAILNIEDRAQLAAQASTDPLTGLANHRTLQERLANEVARASRHGHVLSVALIDVDNFKHVNDLSGHSTGDRVLGRIAECLRRTARGEDMLGRLGGDEFAWVFPETESRAALLALERARLEIATMFAGQGITISGGVCDTTHSEDPAELMHLADGALYWSKAHGRNQCWEYDPSVIRELSAQERLEQLERSQALLGLRALARAIDAKDALTSEHSERVAELVARLAAAAGWAPDRVMMLTEAALVHDVGKIGVPDAVLLKGGPLSPEEFEQVKAHPELGAKIVEEVLGTEQVDWIRKHHERPDGSGYPRGLTVELIPEGAALLALADSWDAMTGTRLYSDPKTVADALHECEGLVGEQFTATAVAALRRLHEAGHLAPAPVRVREASAV
jgi:diguanylate cyclase (GGDEF)-like protein